MKDSKFVQKKKNEVFDANLSKVMPNMMFRTQNGFQQIMYTNSKKMKKKKKKKKKRNDEIY